MQSLAAYAELWCLSNFSFLRGASHPGELVERAKKQGYKAIALTDECSMAGIVRAFEASREHKMPLLVGSQFEVDCAHPFTLIVLACTLQGYGNLCEFITRLRRTTARKGTYRLTLEGIPALEDCVVLVAPAKASTPAQMEAVGRWLLSRFAGRCWLAVSLLRVLGDELWLYRMRQVSELTAIPLVAAGDVHMHVRSRKPLQDVMTATRVGRPLTECGYALQPNAEQHLRTRLRLSQTYPPELLAETLRVVERCHFSMDELRYQYPRRDRACRRDTGHLPARASPTQGAADRYPRGVPPAVRGMLEHELALIGQLQYEAYFLTVADIVQWARAQGILCQGRGSAANSAVCYCLGVTAVDPEVHTMLLFERFISAERGEPPDIDIDFEHQRREEVIQYIYKKYGRERAALTGVVISYRPRSALRDVGRALGIDLERIEAVSKSQHWFDGRGIAPERLRENGFDPEAPVCRLWMALTQQLIGFPRHLSQHPGGFVIARDTLSELVPVENASMPGRSVIQWDKDDLDALRLIKVDILALGMLSAIRRALDLVGAKQGRPLALHEIPKEDKATYDMLSRGDSLGTFQVESRAQMAMLPRLRPEKFYDLVIEVAIVRPGPIQGGMVHPYLRRRNGEEPVDYPSAEVKKALERTLGVPIFQEQVMQLAILAADFTPGEADQLRRAMAAWKRKGGLGPFHERLVGRMVEKGYELAYAERIFKQIEGFGEYGFPESHAASFALLVYASAWLKCHHPDAFLAALLNSQPMGFYAPAQLTQDAKRHGVDVRRADVMHSDWDCTLEGLPHPPAVRLGLRLVKGLKEESAERLVAARLQAPFSSTEDMARRAGLELHEVKLLAAADALMSLSGHRRQQVWDASALRSTPILLKDAPVEEDILELPAALEGEEVVFDYAATGLTLRTHPMALLRPVMARHRMRSSADLQRVPGGKMVRYCGIVTLRQQPETAKGTIFMSLEDEHGTVQIICWKSVREAQRPQMLNARLLAVYGEWQREGDVCNLIAQRLRDMTPLLGRLGTRSRDFH
jgi:error-prone DNA polymerase